MRILVMGRSPGPNWFDPEDEVVVIGQGPAVADGYRALPVPDLTDLEHVMFTLLHEGVSGVDAVYCDFEHAMVVAAVVAQHLGARRAMPLHTAHLGRDKLAQKQAVAAAGLATAPIALVPTSQEERATFRQPAALPLIVKPVFGSAARGVQMVNSEADLTAALGLADLEPTVCEGFVEGTEYHLDAVVSSGRLAVLSAGRYLCNIIETGLTRPTGSVILPLASNERFYDRVETLVAGSLRAFGLTDGVVHLEAFDGPGGLVFSECGFRRGGGKVTDAVAAATQSDYRRTCVRASLGLLGEQPQARPRRSAAWIMFKVEPGVLKRLPDDSEFSDIEGIWQLSLRHDLVGTTLPLMDGVYENIGFVVVTGPDEETTTARLREAEAIFAARAVVSA